MSMAAKVLWGEGLFLRPQHFQRQDQYHEARLHHTASALHPYLWGVAHMEWDAEALKTNTLRQNALSAIFRDGEVFGAAGDGAPGGDTLPPAVDLSALQEVTYYAALPAMPGVKLSHAPQVPAAIPVRPDTYYFAIENRGVLYEQMLKAQSIWVYIPAGIRALQLELIAVTA